MRILTIGEVEVVNGAVLPLIPVIVAFGKGFAVGGTVAAGVLTVADALGIVDVF